MLDYPNSDGVPISQMPTAQIAEYIRDGIEVYDPSVSAEAIMERLRLELDIRKLGDRA